MKKERGKQTDSGVWTEAPFLLRDRRTEGPEEDDDEDDDDEEEVVSSIMGVSEASDFLTKRLSMKEG